LQLLAVNNNATQKKDTASSQLHLKLKKNYPKGWLHKSKRDSEYIGGSV